jgi:hypothetical protein
MLASPRDGALYLLYRLTFRRPPGTHGISLQTANSARAGDAKPRDPSGQPGYRTRRAVVNLRARISRRRPLKRANRWCSGFARLPRSRRRPGTLCPVFAPPAAVACVVSPGPEDAGRLRRLRGERGAAAMRWADAGLLRDGHRPASIRAGRLPARSGPRVRNRRPSPGPRTLPSSQDSTCTGWLTTDPCGISATSRPVPEPQPTTRWAC